VYVLCRKFEFKKTLSLKRGSDGDSQKTGFKTPSTGITRYLTGSVNSNVEVSLPSRDLCIEYDWALKSHAELKPLATEFIAHKH